MRPPICIICGKDFRNGKDPGGLVTFNKTPEELAHNTRMQDQGMVGHQKGVEWFCSKHIQAAEKYKHLTLEKAISKISKADSFFTRIVNYFKI